MVCLLHCKTKGRTPLMDCLKIGKYNSIKGLIPKCNELIDWRLTNAKNETVFAMAESKKNELQSLNIYESIASEKHRLQTNID